MIIATVDTLTTSFLPHASGVRPVEEQARCRRIISQFVRGLHSRVTLPNDRTRGRRTATRESQLLLDGAGTTQVHSIRLRRLSSPAILVLDRSVTHGRQAAN